MPSLVKSWSTTCLRGRPNRWSFLPRHSSMVSLRKAGLTSRTSDGHVSDHRGSVTSGDGYPVIQFQVYPFKS